MPRILLPKVIADLVIIGAIAVVCMLPSLIVGPPVGTGDLYHHLQLAGAYAESFQSGIIVPSWTDAENNGYGSITVRAYPPLAHYLIAICKLVFGSWHIATFAAFTIWSFIGILGVYLWAKESFGDRFGALIAASLFAFAPYHLNQYYNSFMWAEFASLSVLPFGFLFVRRIVSGGNPGDVIGLGIAGALLVLSNLPQLVIGTLGIATYLLFLLTPDTIRNIPRVLVAGSLALLLSAFYWVRTFMEMEWLVISQPNTDPNYDFRNHFLLADLSFDDRFVWFASLILVIALAPTIVAICSSGALTKIWHSKEAKAIVVLCFVAFLLTTPLSRPVWEMVSPLQRIQFPWRLLSLISIGVAMLIGFAASEIRSLRPELRRPRLIILIGIVAVTATFSVKQVVLAAVYSESTSYDSSADAALHKNSLDHWLPTWTPSTAFRPGEPVQAANRSFELTAWSGTTRKINLAAGVPEHIRFGLMYHPHWKASVNGEPRETQLSNGAVGLDIGPEVSQVELRFVEPCYARVSFIVSLLTWLAVIAALVYTSLRSQVRTDKSA